MADYANPEDAYWAFFEAFNAKDRDGWADVMSYPHTRVSARGSVRYYQTPRDYAEGASWEAIEATGWVRTRGIEPVRLHESADKVHLAAGWTRYDAEDEPILSNRVTYILTRVEGSWGIQARFGTDSFNEDESVQASTEAAVGVVRRYVDTLNGGDFSTCATLARLPFTEVGVGEVRQLRSESDLEERLRAAHQSRTSIRHIRAAQVGTSGVNVAVSYGTGSGQPCCALYLVARGDDRWRIAGYSGVAG